MNSEKSRSLRVTDAHLGQNRPHRVGGFTLVEAMVYCAVLVVILALAFEAFYRTWDHSKQAHQRADDLLRTLRAGEQWRADVRRSVRVEQAGADTMRLIQPSGEVRYAFTEGRVLCQRPPSTNYAVVLTNVLRSTMSSDPRARVTALRWELEVASSKSWSRLKPLYTFYAVPRQQSKPPQ